LAILFRESAKDEHVSFAFDILKRLNKQQTNFMDMTSRKSAKHKNVRKKRKNMKLPFAISLLIIVAVAIVVFYVFGMNGSGGSTNIIGNKVLLHTSMGDITIQLRNDKPITTENFKNLVQQGFYDDTVFHRVIADFMIQGGSNSSVAVATIHDEIGNDNHNYRGAISMAKTSQPNSATSQFFINVADNNEIVYQDGIKFDDTYTVFGTVVSGMTVADAISTVETDSNDKPLADVTIINAEIIS
jgi:peptidylprolyl isomerase